ncbi:MAG: S41 family peptidase [Hyphomonas sp.]
MPHIRPFHPFASLAAVAFLASVTACQTAPPDSYRPSEDFSLIKGVWASEGYGWVADIGADQFRLYDRIGDFCASGEDDAGALEDLNSPYDLRNDGEAFRLIFDDPAYKYTFDRLDALPVACGAEHPAGPRDVFAVFDALFRTHYGFFDTRHVDWDALSAAARARIDDSMSDEALFGVLSETVAAVDDGHVSLIGVVDGERERGRSGQGKTNQRLTELALERGVEPRSYINEWREAYKVEVAETLLQGQGVTTGAGWIRYGMIGDDVGYLGFMTMTGYAETDEEDSHEIIEAVMDDAMARFKDARAVIVDLSLNHGGEDTIGRRIARRFASEKTLAYSKFAADAPGAEPQAAYLRPTDDMARFLGPVYLVTSDHTVSAGEILTLSLRALPNVTHVGEATRGALSDILSKPLPNGWTLNLSNEIYLDADGRHWEGVGIPPEIAIAVFSQDDPFTGHVEAISKVVALARED